MTLPTVAFMAHAAVLQMVVLLLRMATSYQGLALGLSPLSIGMISSCFAVLPVLLAIAVGRMTDRYGEFPALLSGSLILVLAALAFVVTGQNAAGLVFSTVLLGLAHFISMVSQHSFITSIGSGARRDSLFGWYAGAIALGQAFGPMLAALQSGGVEPDLRRLFMTALVLAAIHLATLVPVRRGQVSRPSVDLLARTSIGALLRIPGVTMAIVTGIAVMATMDILAIYLPLLGANREIDAAIIASLLTVRALATFASRLTYAPFARTLKRPALFGVTISAGAVGLLLLALPLPVPLMFVAVILLGYGLGMALPITLIWISDIAPPNERGILLSLRQSALRMAQVAIPAAGGVVAGVAGVAATFTCLSALLAAVAATAALRLE